MPRCKFTADILVFHLGEELESLGKQPGNNKKTWKIAKQVFHKPRKQLRWSLFSIGCDVLFLFNKSKSS